MLASTVALVRNLKKLPVVVGNSPGFAGNRMLYARSREVDRLLQEGAPPQQIDSAATAFGFAMGPCAASDLAGLDIGWRMRQARGFSFPVADALCAEGRFGQKTGAGYYRYAAGSLTPEPDAETTRVIAGVGWVISCARILNGQPFWPPAATPRSLDLMASRRIASGGAFWSNAARTAPIRASLTRRSSTWAYNSSLSPK